MRTTERVDRDEMFLEVTRSICAVCKRVLDAEVNARDDQVFLRKRCHDHGSFEARVYGDATMYVEAMVEAMRFNKPGTIPLETQTEVREGCPAVQVARRVDLDHPEAGVLLVLGAQPAVERPRSGRDGRPFSERSPG